MKYVTMSSNQVVSKAIGASAMSQSQSQYQRVSHELYSFMRHDDSAVCQNMGYRTELITSATYTILHTDEFLRINVLVTPLVSQYIKYDLVSGMKTSNVDCMKADFKSLIDTIDRILDVEC